MFRKLVLATAVSLALSPGVSGALGLGGIRTQSALNEPFAGEIDLVDVKPDELDVVKVVLAPAGEFKKVGAARPHFLTKLTFKPQVSSKGRPVVRVSSAEPVREPYLDFLVEVNWPKGRLVKEYTVLLDPPVTLNRPPPQVDRPAVQRPRTAPRPAPRTEPRPVQAPAQAAPSTPPTGAESGEFPLRYPVKSGDGLWRIARSLAPSSATVAQTAMALYRSNREAFIRGDINRLKVGQVLEIPSAAELYALDQAAAEREFDAALRGKPVTSSPMIDVSATPKPEDRLRIAGASERTPAEVATETPTEAPTETPTEAPAETPTEAPAETPTEASTEVSAEYPTETSTLIPAQGIGEPTPGLTGIKEDLLLIQEAGESTRQQTEELNNRIGELESQLTDIRRLLELRNEQLAQLQDVGVEEALEPEAEATDLPPSQTEEESQAPSEEIPPQQPAEVAPEREESELTPPAAEQGVGAPEEEGERTPEPAEGPSFWDSVSMPMVALASAVPLLLLLLGWTILRRRKGLEEAFETPPLPGQGAAHAVEGGETSVVSDAIEERETDVEVAESIPMSAPYSGFGHLDDETEEADIISEADVYIAYGRYREAATVLEEEIQKTPDRLDLKYKLAEANFGAKDLQGLKEIVGEIKDSAGEHIDSGQWERLTSMVQELGGTAAAGSTAMAPPQDPVPPPAWAQSQEPTPPPMAVPTGQEPKEDIGSGSGVDLLHPIVEEEIEATTVFSAEGTAEDRPSEGLGLEIEDLDLLSEELNDGGEESKPAVAGAASDLELQLEDISSLQNVDLGQFDEPSPQPATAEPEEPSADFASLDIGGETLDITPSGKDVAASDVLSSQWQMDSGLWDEVATKIDLARAYLEMEDPEAARVILKEVAEEGNEEQRAEAQEMLSRLS